MQRKRRAKVSKTKPGPVQYLPAQYLPCTAQSFLRCLFCDDVRSAGRQREGDEVAGKKGNAIDKELPEL